MSDSSISGAARNLDAARWLIEQAEAAPAHAHTQVLVASATFWLTSVQDILRSHWDGPKGTPFATALEATEGGATMRGLRVARNEAAHGATLIVTNQGMVFPMFPDGVADFGGVWVGTDELRAAASEPGRYRVRPEDFDAYESQVAGRPPTTPLRVAHEFLAKHLPRH